MSYVTQQDLVLRFGEAELAQLTDRESVPPQDIDAGILAEAIEAAQRVIDGYVGAVATLPLAQPVIDASPLRTVAGDLARYHLYAQQPTEEVRQRRDHGIAWLRDLAAGRAVLPQPQTAPAGGRSRVAPGVSGIDWSTYG